MAIAMIVGGSTAQSAWAGIYNVNTTGDPGPGGTTSLRQAIASANGSDGNTITFDPGLVGSTITLNSEIVVSKGMTIQGPGAGKLTISGNDTSRIFYAHLPTSSTALYIRGLTLAHGYANSSGGAIRASQSDVYVADVRITASRSPEGGGLYAYQSSVNVVRAVITGNIADSGGGVAGANAGVAIVDSTISGNTATYKGGGITQTGGVLILNYSTISGNSIPPPPGTSISQAGGGVYLFHSRLTCGVSTIADNYGYAGGAGLTMADAYSGDHTIIYSSTIAGNSSCCYEGGNGIMSTGGKPYMISTIVANNFNRGGIYDLSGSFGASYSLIRNAADATFPNGSAGTLFGVDPKLGPLGNNGGPTQTMLPAADSPAVDADPGCIFTFTHVSVDQRGVSNCVNGKTDMGAVERQSPEIIILRNGFEPP